eukprot:1148544-Pelagomonas_calceolata.AAC.3
MNSEECSCPKLECNAWIYLFSSECPSLPALAPDMSHAHYHTAGTLIDHKCAGGQAVRLEPGHGGATQGP